LWTNKLLGTATDTGYSYTTYIEDIAGSMKYLYFPYKPCSKAIKDVCDVLQAIQGTNAGPHWIVDTSSRFLLTTIGAHSAAGDNPAQYWPTWWRTDQAGSTLTEGKDFLNFRFQHLAKEANYVGYHGRFKRPSTGDYWTENNSALWDKPGTVGLADDNAAGNYKVGSFSLKGTASAPNDITYWYPSSADAAWPVDKWGGKYNIPRLNFWVKRDANTNDDFNVRLYDHDGDYFYKAVTMTANTWLHVSRELGPYSYLTDDEGAWLESVTPIWTDVHYLAFFITTSGANADLWVDGVSFNGWIIRGARQVAAYTAAAPCKMKMITDEVAKDDSGVATDDSGLMGRLAYAEYLRLSSTPRVGSFNMHMAEDLLPGQLVHLHAKKKDATNYRIDDDFRVMRLIHTINKEQGWITTVDVTDDVKNANPRPMPTQLNKLLSAVRPEFQDRQASSIKTREIDITQAILEKTY